MNESPEIWSVLREIISANSFGSVWYWIFMALAWNSMSHWTMGVPYDSILRAERHGGDFADHVDEIAHAMAHRMNHVMSLAGPWAVGAGFFGLALVGTTGFRLGSEFAQATYAFLLPLMIVTGKEVYYARVITTYNLRGRALRKSLVLQRRLTQLFGIASIGAAAGLFVLHMSFGPQPV